jgi:CelD/BcsL family acetyltransferase involved in cellulose biosynthesis
MNPLSLEALEADAEALDAAVLRTPEIDRFCSSSAWILPASRALSGPRRSFIHRGTHGWLLAMRGESAEGITFVEPLEAAWGMACPLIGPEPQALAEEAAAALAEDPAWQMLLLSGMPHTGELLPTLLRALPRRVLHRQLEPAVRRIASLEGGLDGFLSRRTRNFRKALRAAERDAKDAGITFEPVQVQGEADAAHTYARILEIEARSWKGAEGVGIDQGPMRRFYAEMVLRLSRHGRQRTWFARQEERDVAYCLGAVFDGQYRGLQFSFDRAFERHSLGSLLQLRQIEALVAEGVRRYDLGQDLEYKRRWGEASFETATLLLLRP